jgi:gas vesicle protein
MKNLKSLKYRTIISAFSILPSLAVLANTHHGLGIYQSGKENCQAFVDEHKRVITAAHCIDPQKLGTVTLSENGIKKIAAVKSFRMMNSSVAVLQTERQWDSGLQVASFDGHMSVEVHSAYYGIDSVCEIRSFNQNKNYFVYECSGWRGLSGQPLLQDGKVVGIHIGNFDGDKGLGVPLVEAGMGRVDETFLDWIGFEQHLGGIKVSCCDKLAKAGQKLRNNVSDGVEEIGDGASKLTQHAIEAAKKGGQTAIDMLSSAGETLSDQTRALMLDVHRIAAEATPVFIAIGDTVKKAVVNVGETLTDARERLMKGLTHLPTERWFKFKDIEKNIEKVTTQIKEATDQLVSAMQVLNSLPQVASPAFIADKMGSINIDADINLDLPKVYEIRGLQTPVLKTDVLSGISWHKVEDTLNKAGGDFSRETKKFGRDINREFNKCVTNLADCIANGLAGGPPDEPEDERLQREIEDLRARKLVLLEMRSSRAKMINDGVKEKIDTLSKNLPTLSN